jgi:hypothetical protein
MPVDLQPQIRKHQVFYEVSPYFVLLDLRNYGSPAVKRTVQAGFDVDLYGTAISHELSLSDGDGQMRLALDGLRQAAEAILPNPSDSCAIQIIPFETTLILDTRHYLQPQALLRIRITHCRGLDQPAGPLESLTLKDVEEKLLALGVQAGGART